MIRPILEWCLALAAAALGLFLGLAPVPASAEILSTAITAVTNDVATYGTMVSTIMAAVILVVLAVAGWNLIRRLVDEDGPGTYHEFGGETYFLADAPERDDDLMHAMMDHYGEDEFYDRFYNGGLYS